MRVCFTVSQRLDYGQRTTPAQLPVRPSPKATSTVIYRHEAFHGAFTTGSTVVSTYALYALAFQLNLGTSDLPISTSTAPAPLRSPSSSDILGLSVGAQAGIGGMFPGYATRLLPHQATTTKSQKSCTPTRRGKTACGSR